MKLVDAIDHDFFLDSQEAVLEKWLTYCKNVHLDSIMVWRLKCMAARLTKKEVFQLKNQVGLK